MMITRTLQFSILVSALALGAAGPAMAQSCTRQGVDVTCDDGRRGIFAGESLIWADGTRSNLVSPHPSVIIGNKSSVVIGPGVFAGNGKGGWCRWKIRARRARRAARCWMACRIAIRRDRLRLAAPLLKPSW